MAQMRGTFTDGLGMTVSGVPKDGTPLKVSVAMSDSGTTVHVDGTLASASSSITPQDAISYDALAVGEYIEHDSTQRPHQVHQILPAPPD